jgi:predicted MPP superfamily phosphohydrolase
MSKTRIALFLGIILILLCLVNLAIYQALLHIYSLQSPLQHLTTGLMLGILSASFIISTLLGMWYYNWFTRIYYLISATWMGFMAYLLLASAIYGILILVHTPVSILIGRGLIAMAAITSIYGILHARSIRVKNIEISLPNIPQSWIGKSVVFVSDLHLGQVNGSSRAARVVAAIHSVPHEAVFIGGDLFDGTGAPDLGELIAPFRALHSPHGVFFITGNHEEFATNSHFVAAVRACGIRVLMNEVVEINGLQVVGVDYALTEQKESFRQVLGSLPIDRVRPSILLKHEPKDLDVAHAAGISLQISGHTHRAQQWPLEYIARLAYKGYAYGLKKYQDMQVYVSSGAGTWGPPMRVGTDCEIVVFRFV